jgi:hypothetical protein
MSDPVRLPRAADGEAVASGFLTVSEFKAWSGLGNTTTFKLLGEGALKAVRYGGKTLISRASAEAWAARLPAWNSGASPYKPEVATAAREAKREPAPKAAPRLGARESVASAREAVGAARARAAQLDPRLPPNGLPRDPTRDQPHRPE